MQIGSSRPTHVCSVIITMNLLDLLIKIKIEYFLFIILLNQTDEINFNIFLLKWGQNKAIYLFLVSGNYFFNNHLWHYVFVVFELRLLKYY